MTDDLGTLVQSCQLPILTTGVDAVEARLVVVQELPQKTELRFFSVRDDKRVLLSSAEALVILRKHFPRKPLLDLTQIELLAEVSVLRSDVDRMRPVYEAARAWRAVASKDDFRANAEAYHRLYLALAAAVDAAVTSPLVEAVPPAATLRLRLRVKVWTDPATQTRYLMPQALMRDVKHGKPASAAMIAYAMRDDTTKLVELTIDEWNELPFFYFEEDGAAPRAAKRPVDVW